LQQTVACKKPGGSPHQIQYSDELSKGSMNLECTSAGKRFHRATNVFANIRRAPPPRTLRLTVPSRRSRANECAPAPDYARGRRTACVPSTAFRNARNIAQAAARLPHFHRTCLWSRLKTSIERYARITSEFHTPLPRSKGGTD
jgi:hypothetical protein